MRQERSYDEPIIGQFSVHRNKELALPDLTNCDQLSVIARQDERRVRDSLQDSFPHTGKFAVLLRDVRPPFRSQSDRHTVL